MENIKFQEKVSIKSKLWLSIGDSSCAVLYQLICSGALSYYFTKYLGLSEALAGTAWIIFGIWNAINDPIFGYISDKTKSKIGRRIPYIRYGAIFYSIIFIFTWLKWPFGGSNGVLFVQMLISLFLFDTVYTAIATSLYVMPFEMAVSNKARSGIFIWKIIFSIVPLSVPLILVPMIKPEVGESATTFRIIMAIIGVVAFVLVFISTFFYKEKGYAAKEEQPPFFKAIAQCFKNRAFIVFEVMAFTLTFASTILMQGVAYYFDEFNISMLWCYVSLGIGAIGSMVFWLTQRDKIGLKNCLYVYCVSFALAAGMMTFFGGVFAIAIVCFVLFGIGATGGYYLIPLMNGDVIDFDESLTGLRREGMYAGVNSLVTKPAISLANASFLWIIAKMGYNKTLTAGLQSVQAEKGILVAWMAISFIMFIICIVIMHWYKLNGSKWNETKRNLEIIHNQKEKENIKAVFGNKASEVDSNVEEKDK